MGLVQWEETRAQAGACVQHTLHTLHLYTVPGIAKQPLQRLTPCACDADAPGEQHEDKIGSNGGVGGWSCNLGELSEGQRSLCAIAFVLAAGASGVTPAVLLVDEVDAALDGVNQGRVGELLVHASATLSCQVWAVSHSDAFHACCDTFLKVSKNGDGTSVQLEDAHVKTGGARVGRSHLAVPCRRAAAGQQTAHPKQKARRVS
jgi:ABC-type glutathione transport system ATPase component